MRNAIFTIFLFLSISSIAQNWCHQGSVWHYRLYGGSDNAGLATYTYTGDTTVANHACQKLSSRLYEVSYLSLPYTIDTACGTIFTYSANDTVYFFYPFINSWHAAYYLNAQVGDTIKIANSDVNPTPDSIATALVDSIGNINISGANLRYYYFHILNTCSYGPGGAYQIIERIGMVNNNIVPYWNCGLDFDVYALRCYQDDSLAVYPDTANCDYLYTGIMEIAPNRVSIHPNPANNELTIEVDQNAIGGRLVVYDMESRLLNQSSLFVGKTALDVSSYANGMYLISSVDKFGNKSIQKFTVQH